MSDPPSGYSCIDCGVTVSAFGPAPVPGERCTGCQWVAAIPDPGHRAALRSQLVVHAVIGAPLPLSEALRWQTTRAPTRGWLVDLLSFPRGRHFSDARVLETGAMGGQRVGKSGQEAGDV